MAKTTIAVDDTELIEQFMHASTAGAFWFRDLTRAEPVGSIPAVTITVEDPDDANEIRSIVVTKTAAEIREAFATCIRKDYMCCAEGISADGIGYGCATDMGNLVQRLAYDEIVYG